MPAPIEKSVKRAVQTLENQGLLLVQDKTLPNLVTVLTGEVVEKSWWSHPQGKLIFDVLARLGEHPDVLLTKLIRGKVTLVHRRLWPALLAVVSQGEPWQTKGLSAAARQLLQSADQTDAIVSNGAVVKEIEKRLLAHTHEVHTESGRHAVAIQTWPNWARTVNVKPMRSVAAAKKEIEEAVVRLGADAKTLPWA